MHSLEGIRVLNEIHTMKGTRQKLVGMNLINAETGVQQCTRPFVTIDSAAKFCELRGAEFAGVSKE